MNKKIPVFSAPQLAIATTAVMFALAIVMPSRALAYAIQGPTPGSFSSGNVMNANGAGGGSGYNFGDSFQQLIAPFTGFVNSLQGNTTINVNGAPGYVPPSNLDLGSSGAAPQIQNTILGWLTQIDDWVYAKTGIRLSGIIYVFLSILQWILHIVLGIVGWLLGLFHG